MVYVVQNSQNFSGLFPSSCIPKNTTFWKLDLFPSSGEGGGEDTYSVEPPPSPEDGNRSSFRNVVFFKIQDDGKVQKNSVNSVNIIAHKSPSLLPRLWHNFLPNFYMIRKGKIKLSLRLFKKCGGVNVELHH
jgi:hypothetical protein